MTGKATEVSVFLMADAVACAKAGQKVPQGYYNLELMVKAVARQGEVILKAAPSTPGRLLRRRQQAKSEA